MHRREGAPLGFALKDRRKRVEIVPRPNASRPVSISNSTQPNAQMSARLSTDCPRACSGLMYGAVPRINPARFQSACLPVPVQVRLRSHTIRVRLASVWLELGQAEVEDLYRAVGRDLDIGRLQVAVDDAFFVRRVERVRDLARDRAVFRPTPIGPR